MVFPKYYEARNKEAKKGKKGEKETYQQNEGGKVRTRGIVVKVAALGFYDQLNFLENGQNHYLKMDKTII